jgi:hypothetical protein
MTRFKHDENCRRRKERNPYICTCGMPGLRDVEVPVVAETPKTPSRLVDLNELDALAGEWRSVHNLLMEAAVKARQEELERSDTWASGEDLRSLALYAAACEAVATRLSNP